jgi:hypothetical protein
MLAGDAKTRWHRLQIQMLSVTPNMAALIHLKDQDCAISLAMRATCSSKQEGHTTDELNSIVLAACLPQFSHALPMQAREHPRLIKSLLWAGSHTRSPLHKAAGVARLACQRLACGSHDIIS